MEPETKNATPPTAAAGLRYLIVTVVTFLVSSGRINAENAEGIIAVITALLTVGYGLYKTFKANKAKP